VHFFLKLKNKKIKIIKGVAKPPDLAVNTIPGSWYICSRRCRKIYL